MPAVQKTGEAESITSHYLFALGSYRGLYILNWIYRYFVEDHFEYISVFAGIIQTVLYADFFYLYISRGVCVYFVCAFACVCVCVCVCLCVALYLL